MRVLLFSSPILLWAWHVLTGARREDKGRTTIFWWLLLFSFLPVALTYSVNQVLAQPVWHPRYLVIAAVPYMILVAVAVERLRPNWVRAAAMLLVVGWATTAGFRELYNLNLSSRLSNHKIGWEALVRQMIQVEPPQADTIRVYAFEWMVAVPMQFYLDEAREKRFQVVQIVIDEDDGPDRIRGFIAYQPFWTTKPKETAALDGDHFWIALHEYQRKKIERILMERGYQVGKGFKEPRGYILSPVWRS